MSDAANTEFAPDELSSQAQGNAAAFVLTTIAFLKERKLDPDEYFAFFGRRFAPGWEELRGRPVADVARTAALNAVSVGATLRSLSGDDTRAEVLVTEWPGEEFLDELQLTQDDSELLWNSFYPIMEHLGIHYQWRREEGDAVRMTFEANRE